MIKRISLLLLLIAPIMLYAQSNTYHSEMSIFESKGINNKYLTNTNKCNVNIEIADSQIWIKGQDLNTCWNVINKQQVGEALIYLVTKSDDEDRRIVFAHYSNKIIIINDKFTLTYIY